MSDPFILCDGLVKIYKVADLEMVALRELNLTINKGELVGIIGSSGSGKTTIMNILGGLDRPSAGRVIVDGHDLLRMTDRQMNKYRREKVGFVWQQSARNLVPYLNAIDNVMLPMTLAGITGKGKRKRAEELLDLVGLRERMKHYLPELSGGEQQRVAIAVGLANNPTLLLADEPTGEVDSATAKTIYDTFRTLTGEMGITTLIVSHDPGIARQVERVVGIRDGMLASETLRQTRTSQVESEDSNGKVTTESHEEHHYEELVVVDRAGRLHIPKEYLEQFSIRGRAQLEVTEHGILIRSTEQDRIEVEVTKQHHTQGQGSSTGGLLGRLGLGRSKAPEKIIEQKKVE
jgi:ABC-type lipoprotein export system ATPase subunit/bifunctional DNA-binding transcriptional regulator/antitoxin component of YhaV-PrlF toxin-antitoxin module